MTVRISVPEFGVNLTRDERCLDRHAVESIPGLRVGDAIICTSSLLWVTQEGDPEDYMLQRSGAFVAKRQGVVVVEALAEAAYSLSTSARMFASSK